MFLQAFSIVFQRAMRNSEKADTLRNRILNLLENITYQSFVYTSRGLFEKDKLIFITQMVIQVSTYINMKYILDLIKLYTLHKLL